MFAERAVGDGFRGFGTVTRYPQSKYAEIRYDFSVCSQASRVLTENLGKLFMHPASGAALPRRIYFSLLWPKERINVVRSKRELKQVGEENGPVRLIDNKYYKKLKN